MGIQNDFSSYWDGNGLLTPGPVVPGTRQGSDNGTMYTSEYYVMLQKMNQLTHQDINDFQQKIGQCVNPEGMLCRVPVGQDDGQEQVDNYHGVLNGCMALGNTVIPRQFLKAIIKYKGFMDNEQPGRLWNWNSFIPRQLQIVAAMIAAAFPSWKNPLHILIRLLSFPFFLFAALIIGTSCITATPTDTDARRLSWHLQNTLKGVSLFCWLASLIWKRRLYKDFPNGMKDIAAMYYNPHPDNPYSKYWIT